MSFTAVAPARRVAAASLDTPPHQYVLFGVRVDSDLRLPLAPLVNDRPPAPPAWVIRRAPHGQTPPQPDGPIVGSESCIQHGPELVVHRGPGGAWIWHRTVGTYHISPDARTVTIYLNTLATERAVGLLAVGHVAVYVLHQLGYPTLHASAIVTATGAVAFLARNGGGKSTMAASFVRRGAQLLTDDVLPLHVSDEAVLGAPGVPLMKLFPESAEQTLGVDDGLEELAPGVDKKLLLLDERFPFASQAAPLRAFYVLDRRPAGDQLVDISILRLTKREALTVLLAQVSNGAFLQPPEAARFLPLYARLIDQAPMRLVTYPSTFADQESVFEAINADLEDGAR